MRKQTKLWTTKTGERVRICDMEDDRVVACINTIKQYATARLNHKLTQYLTFATEKELERRLDRIADHSWQHWVPPVFFYMIKDIKRRMVLRPGIVKNLIGIPNWILEGS